jgi:hypothetical protein
MAKAFDNLLQLEGNHRFVLDNQDFRRQRGCEVSLCLFQDLRQFFWPDFQDCRNALESSCSTAVRNSARRDSDDKF